MKKAKFLIAILLVSLLFTGCGNSNAPEPEPSPEPTPEPTPEPFVEPVLDKGGSVSFDGQELSASYIKNDVQYVKLSEAVNAIGEEITVDAENNTFSFPWRNSTVILNGDSRDIIFLETNDLLSDETILCDNRNDLYVPVNSFCDIIQIGLYYDEEFDHLYCTPGSGSWTVPEGYNVPVMMYHGIKESAPAEANLFVSVSSFENQLKYLTENGYTTILFEDLWHVQDFEKPVLLTFDDGWANNYTEMFPALEKYNCKATIFVVKSFIHDVPTNHLSLDNLHELAKSDLISIQSHTVDHYNLDELNKDQQRRQLSESAQYITRETGKEPFVLAYPTGRQNDTTLELLPEYYHFGVKMMTYPYSCYNTSDNPGLIYRFFPERQTSLETYISWLEQSFPASKSETAPNT